MHTSNFVIYSYPIWYIRWMAPEEGNCTAFTVIEDKSNSINIITLATAQKSFSLIFQNNLWLSVMHLASNLAVDMVPPPASLSVCT